MAEKGKGIVSKKGRVWFKLPWRKEPIEYVANEILKSKEDIAFLIEKANETGAEITFTENKERPVIGLIVNPETGSVTVGYKGAITSKSVTISPPTRGEEKPNIIETPESHDAR